jgi:hypothetical protein
MLDSVRDGFRIANRSRGLAVLLWALNIGLAAGLALPLAGILERALHGTGAAEGMMYGFDYPWWSAWSDERNDFARTFAPEIFGVGFAFRNVELLLKGSLPAALYARRERGSDSSAAPPGPELDPVILATGVVYLLAQTFLAGGLIGVFRAPQGHWTARGLLHGSGFYFGRFLRLLALSLLALWAVFRLDASLAPFADRRALESVSESGALAWSLGRHGLLLVTILFLHMVASYAKVIVVLEERSSAVLAYLSALGFGVRHLLRAFGHYLAFVLVAVALLAAWNALDARWYAVGYRTQVVTLALAQAFVVGRIFVRLSLLAGQVALYRRLNPAPGGPDA